MKFLFGISIEEQIVFQSIGNLEISFTILNLPLFKAVWFCSGGHDMGYRTPFRLVFSRLRIGLAHFYALSWIPVLLVENSDK